MWTNSAWTIGSELTQFDADMAAIAKAVEVMALYYTHERAPLANIFLFSNNSSAIQAVKNPWSHKAHAYALRFHQVLTVADDFSYICLDKSKES